MRSECELITVNAHVYVIQRRKFSTKSTTTATITIIILDFEDAAVKLPVLGGVETFRLSLTNDTIEAASILAC